MSAAAAQKAQANPTRAGGAQPATGDDRVHGPPSKPRPQLPRQATRLPEGWTWKTRGELAANEPNSITDGPFGSKLTIPLPPLAEQIWIVAEIQRQLSVVDELDSVVSTNLQRAARLRQSLPTSAFSRRF